MHAVVRSSVLSGATLLTAGAIAVAPMQPTLPHLQPISHAMSTLAVELTASPFDLYGEVIQSTLANLQNDVTNAFSHGPVPLIRQILTNQLASATGLVDALGDSGRGLLTSLFQQTPAYVGAALKDFTQANVEGALNNLQLAIVSPILAAINPLGTLPTAIAAAISRPLTSIINIANDLPSILLDGGIALIAPIFGGLGAAGEAVQNVINAVKAGSFSKLVTAVIQAPATMVDGILNGGYGPNLGPLVGLNIPGFTLLAGGLFGGGGTSPNGNIFQGTFGALTDIVSTILRDITPATSTDTAATAAAAKSAAAAVPAATAKTVALSAASTKAAVSGTSASTSSDSAASTLAAVKADRKRNHDKASDGSTTAATGTDSSSTSTSTDSSSAAKSSEHKARHAGSGSASSSSASSGSTGSANGSHSGSKGKSNSHHGS